jgi:hypothetical protein
MIEPDDKDWTWVLTRPCPECRFDASTYRPEDVPEEVRRNAVAWQELLEQGAVRKGRPSESTWSTLEYACHVRDVYRRYHQRIELMLSQDDPLFPNWDQDASAVEDAYDTQDPVLVVNDLVAAAEQVANQLAEVSGQSWTRTGRRSDGAEFTVSTIARYMVHDPVHHIWDVRRQVGVRDRR